MGRAASVRLLGVWLDVEFDLLAFVQLIEGGLIDRTAVEEYLFRAVRGLDEAESSVANDLTDVSCRNM